MTEPARLAGKTALVTGASSGVGRATACLLAEHGARVVAADVDVTGGSETVSRIGRRGGHALFVATDVCSESDVEQAISRCFSAFGDLDLVYHNAAIYRVLAAFEDCSLDQWEETIRVNATGAFLISKYAFAAMKDAGRGGRIVNTVTVLPRKDDGWDPTWGSIPDYFASKGAVVNLTTHLAAMGAPHGIAANCLSPNSAVNTPMQRGSSPQMRAAVLGAVLEPEDIALAALYLATSSLSGAIVAVSPTPAGPAKYEVAYQYAMEPIDINSLPSPLG
jgi:NAD(P)-dependent dehydrogenase (short-subunit alcohol dehydrogenase family)